MAGCWRFSGVASRLPAMSKKMGMPPAEEKSSMSGGVRPNAGVSR